MAKCKVTGLKVASTAGKLLRDPKVTKAVKSAAASALSQKQAKKR